MCNKCGCHSHLKSIVGIVSIVHCKKENFALSCNGTVYTWGTKPSTSSSQQCEPSSTPRPLRLSLLQGRKVRQICPTNNSLLLLIGIHLCSTTTLSYISHILFFR
jgi:hypothetical protein